jgi:hypothetical protein
MLLSNSSFHPWVKGSVKFSCSRPWVHRCCHTSKILDGNYKEKWKKKNRKTTLTLQFIIQFAKNLPMFQFLYCILPIYHSIRNISLHRFSIKLYKKRITWPTHDVKCSFYSHKNYRKVIISFFLLKKKMQPWEGLFLFSFFVFSEFFN